MIWWINKCRAGVVVENFENCDRNEGVYRIRNRLERQ